MERPEEMVSSALAAEIPAFTAERLIEEAQAYSQDAWAYIYDRYYPRWFSTAICAQATEPARTI